MKMMFNLFVVMIFIVVFNTWLFFFFSSIRSPMGFLEYRCIYLYQMCWNPQKSWGSYIQGQVSQPRPMDARTDTGKHILTEKLLKIFKISLKSLTFFASKN